MGLQVVIGDNSNDDFTSGTCLLVVLLVLSVFAVVVVMVETMIVVSCLCYSVYLLLVLPVVGDGECCSRRDSC